MKKVIFLFVSILFTIILGCEKKNSSIAKNEFILKGELEGIENGTWINLVFDNKIIDSTEVSENCFSFKGNLEHPKEFLIYIEDSPNNARIWLEPKTVTFKAKSGEFRNAEIIGSKTQNEQDILRSSLKNYRKRRDSLTEIYRDPRTSDSQKKIVSERLQIIYDNHTVIERDFIKKNPVS